MHIAEPMTLVTDYILALLGGVLGWRLWNLGPAYAPCRWWAGAFWMMALAAFLGGTAHGFVEVLSEGLHSQVWLATMIVLGAAASAMVYALVRTLGYGRVWAIVLAVELSCYVAWIVGFDSDFRYAVAQYGGALVLVLIVHLVLAARGVAGAWLVVVGVLISFVAAWIQQAGVAPHPAFNHNDLYHVVQMVGLIVLYRGVRAGAAETAAHQST